MNKLACLMLGALALCWGLSGCGKKAETTAEKAVAEAQAAATAAETQAAEAVAEAKEAVAGAVDQASEAAAAAAEAAKEALPPQ